MVRKEIRKIINKAIKDLGYNALDFSVETPLEKNHGDYSTNIALKLGKDPIKVANEIELRIKNYELEIFEKIEIAGPGFINFFLSDEYLKKTKISTKLNIGKGKKINVEFISANPTGPLTLGNGRGGFGGDVFSNVLEKAGYNVTREFYVNDRGKQIKDLKEGVYKGEKRIVSQIQKENRKIITKKMKINFDVWFSEKSLTKEIDKSLALLKKKGLTYEKDNALWFKSTSFSDDKDRVLVRENGETTYLASDVAYLRNKFSRGFDKLIIFLGADHHGYIGRMKAVVEALGYDKEQLDFIIMQMVTLMESGKIKKMSKRAGVYKTIEELIDSLELDVARFFFIQRGANSHLVFDLDLAKEKSQKNPVYYVQYAYARMSSILRKAKIKPSKDFNSLKKEDMDLIRQIIKFPEIVEDTAGDYQIQRIPQYAMELAESFHRFYQFCPVINEDKKLSASRLALVKATQDILKQTLDLMGISAPEKM